MTLIVLPSTCLAVGGDCFKGASQLATATFNGPFVFGSSLFAGTGLISVTISHQGKQYTTRSTTKLELRSFTITQAIHLQKKSSKLAYELNLDSLRHRSGKLDTDLKIVQAMHEAERSPVPTIRRCH